MYSKSFLKKYLADNYALLLKTQTFHWNVSGTRFYDLHLMFEDQYNDLFQAVDNIAERIRALGQYAPGGLITYADMTSIDDPQEDLEANDMIRSLIWDHSALRDDARINSKYALQNEDEATADIMITRIQKHEKYIWMMNSILDNHPHDEFDNHNSAIPFMKILEPPTFASNICAQKKKEKKSDQ